MLDLFMLGHGGTHLAEGPAFDQGEVVLHHVAARQASNNCSTVMPG
jgi:hypothetical protein